jgi:signal transduction histidine kinase
MTAPTRRRRKLPALPTALAKRLPASPWPPASLRARITLGFTLSFAVFVLAASVGALSWSARVDQQDAEERVRAAARLVKEEWNGSTAAQSVSAAFKEVREDARLDNITLSITDTEGRLLGVSGLPISRLPTSGALWLTAKETTPTATIMAGMDRRAALTGLHRQAMVLLALGMLVTSAAGVSAWTLVGRTLRPIGALSEQADTASANPLHARLLPPSEDTEVKRLVSTLNAFLERLRRSTYQREQFYAAAAHELRTPLAVLSGSIEVTLSRPRDNSEYHETLQDLQQQTNRLIKLTEGLLTLNRMDMLSGEPEETEPVCFADLCGRVLVALQPLIAERGLVLDSDLDATAEVMTSPTYAMIFVRNLIENAVKYADAGGTVAVSVRGDAEGTRLSVRNDFPASSPLDIERLFTPFFRAEGSHRSGTTGNGLGLAICKAIADANGWRLDLRQTHRGVEAEVLLPASSARPSESFFR